MVCTANQWIAFYMIKTSLMKELIKFFYMSCNILPHYSAVIRKIANINFFNKKENTFKNILNINKRRLFLVAHHIWVKVFKNGPSKICGKQPLKNLK